MFEIPLLLALVSGAVAVGTGTASAYFAKKSRDAGAILREFELRERRESAMPKSQMERDRWVESVQRELAHKSATARSAALAASAMCVVTGYVHWYRKRGPRRPAYAPWW